MEAICSITCSLSFVVAVVGGLYWRHRRRNTALEGFCDQYQLSLERAEEESECQARIRGQWQGLDIRIEWVRLAAFLGSARKRKPYTVFSSRLPDASLPEMMLCAQNWLSKPLLTDVHGHRDIAVGIPRIDEHFLVIGDHADAIRSFFALDGVGASIAELHGQASVLLGPGVILRSRGPWLEIAVERYRSDNDVLRKILDVLSQQARSLSADIWHRRRI